MSTSPQKIRAKRFDGVTPIARKVRIQVADGSLSVSAREQTLQFALDELKVSPRIGSTERFVNLPDGTQLLTADAPWLEQLPQAVGEGAAAWLERRVWAAVGALVLLVVSGVLAYTVGLPVAADWAAERVPASVEVQMGRDALDTLDGLMLQDSSLDEAAVAPVRTGFGTLTRHVSMAPHYQLEFRAAPRLGPNAVALPGGVIIVTDQLVGVCPSHEEIVAILAHEIAHVELRHALGQVMREAGVASLFAALMGDASGSTFSAAALPLALANTRYSREAESAADEFALDLLHRCGFRPAALADALENLVQATRDAHTDGVSTYLSTHPATSARIERARAWTPR